MLLNLALILISAVFYVVSFPWWSVAIAAFFTLIPLFHVVEKSASIPRAMGYGALWGMLVSVGMGYWLFPTLMGHFGVSLPKALLFFTVSVTLPVCLIHAGWAAVYRFVHHPGLAWYALVVPSTWVLTEYLKEVVPFLVPWGGIGYAALPFYRFVQVADLGGVHGVAWIVVMINAVAWFMLRRLFMVNRNAYPDAVRNPAVLWKTFCPAMAVLFLAVGLPVVYGAARINDINREINQEMNREVRQEINEKIKGKSGGERSVQAVLVQGNFDLHDSWSGMGFYRRLQTYLEMSDPAKQDSRGGEAYPDRARVVVWPETMLNEPAHLDKALFERIMAVMGQETLLVSGGLGRDESTGHQTNCAYLVSGQGVVMRYDKHILLPYAETSNMFDWLGQYYTAPTEFVAGRIPPRVDTPHGRAGVSICVEILYPGYVARSVHSGATFLVNISNDAWFGDSPMPRMHLDAARMRAIENRRFLLRSANSGISALITPLGDIAARTDLFERAAISGDFYHMHMASPFTRHGNWVVFFSAGALGLALLRIVFIKP